MEEIKEFYLSGNYLEVGIKTIYLMVLMLLIICFIVFLVQDLIKTDFKSMFIKDGVIEIKQGFKELIEYSLPIIVIIAGIITIITALKYVIFR